MAANKAFSITPQLRPEPRWQGMAISLALYASVILVALAMHRFPSTSEQPTATPEEIKAAREQLQKRQVRMVYLPPLPQPRPAAQAPPPKLLPPKSSGPAKPPEPDADPIKALKSPVADPGGDAAKLGEGAPENAHQVAPPRPIPLALLPGPSAPPAPEPAPNPAAASPGTFGGISLGPRVGLPPRDPRPWTASMPERGDSCPSVTADSNAKPGEPRMGSASGRVLRTEGGPPLPDAHLQIIGTAFVAWTDQNGEYTLSFDASLLDRCRTQYVRVSAPGYEPRLLVLVIGRNVRSDDVALRRH